MSDLNQTHNPDLKSWLDSANVEGADFPIQNLPFGVFRYQGEVRLGVAIGDQIVDLKRAVSSGFLGDLPEQVEQALSRESLNDFMALGPKQWSLVRGLLSSALSAGKAQSTGEGLVDALLKQSDVAMQLPAQTRDYTDFYASVFHATNVGRLFRPDNPLLPNYKHVPIGYHGRASSLVVSGAQIPRPSGQTRGPVPKNGKAPDPKFGPCRLLDYEVEVGFFIGPGNRLGKPIPAAEAEDHLFGACLVNDWSARDLQAWEYQPLGPFLAKSFATQVSPWVVTMQALAPFRGPVFERPEGDPEPLPYLVDGVDLERAGVDLTVEGFLRSPAMREQGHEPFRLSRATTLDLYWTPGQMLTHHSSNGCNLTPGDLFATGTVSGPSDEARGCLLEITRRGAEPVSMPSGEDRSFLEDGDEVILTGRCEREGYRSIGFGECRGLVG